MVQFLIFGATSILSPMMGAPVDIPTCSVPFLHILTNIVISHLFIMTLLTYVR